MNLYSLFRFSQSLPPYVHSQKTRTSEVCSLSAPTPVGRGLPRWPGMLLGAMYVATIFRAPAGIWDLITLGIDLFCI